MVLYEQAVRMIHGPTCARMASSRSMQKVGGVGTASQQGR